MYVLAALLKKRKTPGHSAKGQKVRVFRQNIESMVCPARPQAGHGPIFGRAKEERIPAVTIGHTWDARADVGGVTSPGGDVVSFGSMAKLWDCVPWFDADIQSFDPANLFDAIS